MPTVAEYSYKPDDGPFVCTDEMKRDYEEYGFFMVRGLFSKEEMTKVVTTIQDSSEIQDTVYALPAGDGDPGGRLSLWSHPGDDVTGMVSRCERIVTTSENILGGEVYHYHTKIILKQPFTGGIFRWHQDYGYWYKNGCLFPQLITAYIAMDVTNKENGCLQILKGSHKAGRIEHNFVGGQTGSDVERVEQLSKVCELIYVEQEPGDCLFFDCNIVHKSDANSGPTRRWAFLSSYNRASNNPAYVHHHPQYTPLHKVPDSAIMDCTNMTDMSGKEFLNPKIDKTIKLETDDGEKKEQD